MSQEAVFDAPAVPMRAAGPDRAFNADDTRVFLDPPYARVFRYAVSVWALAVYAAYLIYRAGFTINVDAIGFSLLVYFAEVHGFLSLVFFFHQVWAPCGRRVVEPAPGVSVDVFITTYNEDVRLLRQTLRSAVGMRYPHRTLVLDDGRRPEVRALAAELGCIYITRSDNTHAKAGNWNNAFRQTTAELIATFDADHVPGPQFLERTLGFFRDPKVALVQVPQQYHNLDSVQHRVSWKARRMYGEQDAFFNLVMPGKDRWNAAFFCGTGAVLRRTALEPHGGILTGTITEDLHTSIVLHSEGWKSVYLNETLVTGLAPMDLKSFETQRLRWAEGNLRVAGYVNPLTAPGLTVAQRMSYIASLYHWTIGVPKLIYYLAPPWILFSGTFPIANFDRTFVAIYLCFLGTLVGAYSVASRGKGRLLLDEVFNMVSFFTLIRALKRVAIGRGKPGGFEVTRKSGPSERDSGPVLPHVLLLGFSLLAIGWSLMGLGFGATDDRVGVGVAIGWTIYNMALMLIVVRLGMRPSEKRDGSRFHANFAVEARGEGRWAGVVGVTADISDGGCALLWPAPIDRGTQLPVRVNFGSQMADWTAEVMSDQGRQPDGWYRYGIRFLDLSQVDRDLIHDSIFSLVVPELFAHLSTPSRAERVWRWTQRMSYPWHRTRARRVHVRMPARVDAPGGAFVVAARDVSATGVSLAAPRPVVPGTEVGLSIFGPGRAWRGHVVVARCEPRPSRPGFDTWLLGLRFRGVEAAADAEALYDESAA